MSNLRKRAAHHAQPRRVRRAAPEAHPQPVAPDHHRPRHRPADRADGHLRRHQQQGRRPRRHRHPGCHGGDAPDGHQLRPHGARVPQRRLRLHLRRPGDPSRARLRHGLEHGDGLHPEPADLHGDLRQARRERSVRPRTPLLRVGGLLRPALHDPQPARRQNLGADRRMALRGNDGGRPGVPGGGDPLRLGAAGAGRPVLHPAVLRQGDVQHGQPVPRDVGRRADLHRLRCASRRSRRKPRTRSATF